MGGLPLGEAPLRLSKALHRRRKGRGPLWPSFVSDRAGVLILLSKSIPYKFGRPLVDRICSRKSGICHFFDT